MKENKILIQLDIVAAKELQKAIAAELEKEDGDLEEILKNEKEKTAQDSNSAT